MKKQKLTHTHREKSYVCFQMIFVRGAMRKKRKINSCVRISFLHSLAIFVKLEKRNIKKIASVSGGIVWRKIVLEVFASQFHIQRQTKVAKSSLAK